MSLLESKCIAGISSIWKCVKDGGKERYSERVCWNVVFCYMFLVFTGLSWWCDSVIHVAMLPLFCVFILSLALLHIVIPPIRQLSCFLAQKMCYIILVWGKWEERRNHVIPEDRVVPKLKDGMKPQHMEEYT